MSANTIIILKSGFTGSEAYEEAVRTHGLTPLTESILRAEDLGADYVCVQGDAALVFTSAQGVETFARHHTGRSMPAYAVGDNTMQALQAAGFTNVGSAQGDALDLAALLLEKAESFRSKPLFYIRAEQISHDLRGILAQKNINLSEIIAYRMIEAEKLSLKLLHAVDKRDIKAVLFFSARGASNFCSLIQQYDRESLFKNVKALCIGPSVVQSVSVLPFSDVRTSLTPDRDGMLRLIEHISIE